MRRGARMVGLDNSSNQLATARLFQTEFDLRFPLVHADAQRAPFADESFDFADLSVRSRDLVRPVQVGPRSVTDTATGRPARVGVGLIIGDVLLSLR